MRRIALLAALVLSCGAPPLAAPGPDTLTLAQVLEAARNRDPREAQLALERTRSALRLARIGADRLPSARVSAQAQYQSEVTSLADALAGEPPFPLPTPSRDTYDARLDVRQPIFDPTIGSRRSVERASQAETEARIETALYGLRAEAIEAFFAAALFQERAAAIDATIADLESALGVAAARVREGSALRSEEAALRAELLRRRQDGDEARAERLAALAIVSELTGMKTGPGLVVRAGAGAIDTSLPDSIARPELERFARSRERLALQERALSSSDLPRLAAFGRVGYGRPGLNLLGDEFGGWWVGGLQLEWSPRLWGNEGRERELLRLEGEVVATEEAAFRASIARAGAHDAAAVARLARAAALDDEIVRLREDVERETRIRFDEGVVTSAELVDRSTDVLAARIARATHRIELARARARYLNLMGLEVD
ncbi:MAG TPA: TolC family protein [Gemmatimonadales bacterium]|nr:TolC family protein [Gemmatimonadales bacterium]